MRIRITVSRRASFDGFHVRLLQKGEEFTVNGEGEDYIPAKLARDLLVREHAEAA